MNISLIDIPFSVLKKKHYEMIYENVKGIEICYQNNPTPI